MLKSTLIFSFVLFFTFQGLACSCFPGTLNFFSNTHPDAQIGVIRLDSTYVGQNQGGDPMPMAVFTLVENYTFDSKVAGDTLLVFGQDGINCAVGFGQFNIGDTLVASLGLQDGILYIPFFSNFGGTCGTHYLPIQNGQYNGLSLSAIREITFSTITSVQELAPANALHVYPNPARETITIEGKVTGEVALRLLNAAGQTVEYLPATAFRPEEALDVSHLPQGIYFLRLEGRASMTTIKWAKM